MQLYEFTYLISPEASKQDIASLEEKIKSFIEKEEGSISKSNIPVKKNLAYAIKKKKEAFLADLIFTLKPEKLKGLEKKLKEEKQILRYLIFRVEPPKKRKLKPAVRKKIKPKTKVELKEIEKKLDEILND